MNHRRLMSLASAALLSVVGAAFPDLTSPSNKLTGKRFSGQFTGSKTGAWSCSMTDEYNCRGTWTVNNADCQFNFGLNGGEGKTGGGSIACATGYGSVSIPKFSVSAINGSWFGSFQVTAGSSNTQQYSGSFTGSEESGSGGSTSSGSLVGTWDLMNGSLLVARQTFSGSATSGTGAARTWSITAPRLDGVYTEYSYTATSSSYTTTVTNLLMCDYLKGLWVASTQRPSGVTTFSLANSGNTLVFSNGDRYSRSSSSITKPVAGDACSKA